MRREHAESVIDDEDVATKRLAADVDNAPSSRGNDRAPGRRGDVNARVVTFERIPVVRSHLAKPGDDLSLHRHDKWAVPKSGSADAGVDRRESPVLVSSYLGLEQWQQTLGNRHALMVEGRSFDPYGETLFGAIAGHVGAFHHDWQIARVRVRRDADDRPAVAVGRLQLEQSVGESGVHYRRLVRPNAEEPGSSLANDFGARFESRPW